VAPQPSGAELEAREERMLQAGKGDIYGIPRAEWTKLQSPARYLGNEFGSIHKAWDSANIRFALTYPEIYEGRAFDAAKDSLAHSQPAAVPHCITPPPLPNATLSQWAPPTSATSSSTAC
jgi:hypothetical protein